MTALSPHPCESLPLLSASTCQESTLLGPCTLALHLVFYDSEYDSFHHRHNLLLWSELTPQLRTSSFRQTFF